jgi:hypothetical protein
MTPNLYAIQGFVQSKPMTVFVKTGYGITKAVEYATKVLDLEDKSLGIVEIYDTDTFYTHGQVLQNHYH